MAQDTVFGADSPRRRLLRDQVQVVKRKDSDRYEIVPIQDSLSFEKGFFIFIRACQLLAQKNDGIILVGVAGPSGAGKTVFTEKILNFMPSIAVITMDNYNDSSRIIDGNFDDPRLTDYDTLLENIQGLKAGKPVQVPVYDFKSSSRIGYRTVEVPSSRIVIIEGIYALSEKLRPLLDLRVSVTGGVHFDLVKRVLRDIHRAGQEPEEIIHELNSRGRIPVAMAAAAATPSWQPQEQGFKEICGLLEQQISHSSSADKAQIWQHLQRYSHLPDFNNYLAFIFSRAEGKSVEVRQAAGLYLKNNLRNAYKSMQPAYQQYVKSELLPCLGAADKHIRSTTGTIISVVVEIGGVVGWPELLQALVNCLDSNDLNHMEGAMDALSKICEDIPQYLDSDVPGLAERPINIFLPRLFRFFQSPHASLRKLSLGSVNQYIMLMPSALYVSMDQYLQGLFILSNDPSAEVRKLVCAAFVQLIEVRPSFLEPHLRNVIEYMLQVNKDTDEEVALEACEFWSAYCDAQLPPENLREFLPRLIPVLLSNMAYADDDESLIEAEEDGSQPDRDQDLKPRFHASRFHGSDEAEDEDDDVVNTWNLRKCSAAALDILSNVFGDEILPTLMPIVEAKLSAGGDDAWKEREAAVLALGAIGEGCINGLYPHLLEIVAFLIPLLDDKFPLIRSISCWTLSRFSKFIVQGIGHPKGYEQFDNVLMGLLRRILDDNKRVQEAACSAFATLEEEAAEELAPRLEIILKHLMTAFGKYQRRNLRIVYDAIGTLAEAVGGELNQPGYLEILMPPLIEKWQQLSNSDKDLFPLLECFTSIAHALGTGFTQFAEPVFRRCINIIQTQQFAKADSTTTGVQYDKEFIVCSLDLLSGLAEGLGSGIESLVAQCSLRDLLLHCCVDDASDVRQSAFALLGDLARVCPVHLHPRLSEFLEAAAKQLEISKVKEAISVANNACWAIGELAVKVRQEISPVVLTVISSLVPILQHAEGLNKSLIENSAITLGRLAWVCPELVSPHMEHFMQSWCTALSMIRDDVEKEDAFRGLCAMVKANPSGALSSLVYMCKAIASWHEIRSEDLHNEVCQVLHGYKQMLRNGAWDQCMSALEPPVKEKLSKYQV